MVISHSIQLFALNVAIASLICSAIALIVAACFALLPKRYATLVLGMIACLFAPVLVGFGTAYSLGKLPAIAMLETSHEAIVSSPISGDSIVSVPSSNKDQYLEHPLIATAPLPSAANLQTSVHANAVTLPPHRPVNDLSLVTAAGPALLVIWSLGMVLTSVAQLRKQHRCRNFLATCRPVSDLNVRQLFDRVAERLSVRGSIALLESDVLPTPVVIALGRPKVVLPTDISTSLSTAQLTGVLAHELSHIRRKDNWMVAVQTIVLIVYWWNPLVHLASRRASELREMICDDIATSYEVSSKEYARTIIQMAERTATTSRLVGSLGISLSPVSELERRLRRIIAAQTGNVDLRISKRFVCSLCLWVIVLGAGLLFAQVPQGASKESADAKQTAAAESVNKFGKPSMKQMEVTGIVVDATGQPVADAIVHVESVRDDVNATAISGTDGRYRFELRMYNGRLELAKLWAESRDGSMLCFHRFPFARTDVSLQNIKLTMEAVKFASVQVVDAMGKPIRDANTAIDTGSPYKMGPLKTDANGMAKFTVPQSSKIVSAIAWKDDRGMDYRSYVVPSDRAADLNAKAPEFPQAGPQVLKLEGANPLAVHITDDQNRPLLGATADVWMLNKNASGESFNLSYYSGLIQSETDARGNASFDWFPAWQRNGAYVFAYADGFIRKQMPIDPSVNGFSIALQRAVPVRGQVVFADGTPAANIALTGIGRSEIVTDSFRGDVITDTNGRYEMLVASNQQYKFFVQDDRWCADVQSDISITAGQTVEDRNFVLARTSRIHGKVIDAASGQAAPRTYVTLSQYAVDPDELLNKISFEPAPTRFPQPLRFQNTMSNDQGEYEFFVGKGDYRVSLVGPSEQYPTEKVTISSDSDKEVDLRFGSSAKTELSGIVTDENGQPLAGAHITGTSRQTSFYGQWAAITDQAGQFKVRRTKAEDNIRVISADGKLGAAAVAKADDSALEIRLQRLGSAAARLVKEQGNAPLANERINVMAIEDGTQKGMRFFRIVDFTTTDDQGNLKLERLIPGVAYSLSPANLQGIGVNVREIKVDAGQEIELGDIRLPSMPAAPAPLPSGNKANAK
jgi:beta-lactamase regulating signal transducer with metallopeptidase domain